MGWALFVVYYAQPYFFHMPDASSFYQSIGAAGSQKTMIDEAVRWLTIQDLPFLLSSVFWLIRVIFHSGTTTSLIPFEAAFWWSSPSATVSLWSRTPTDANTPSQTATLRLSARSWLERFSWMRRSRWSARHRREWALGNGSISWVVSFECLFRASLWLLHSHRIILSKSMQTNWTIGNMFDAI